MQDAVSYQELLDRLERAEALAAIRQGIDSSSGAKACRSKRPRSDCGRSMAFRVEIAPQAFDDLDRIAAYITAESSFDAAETWFDGMMDAIGSLDADADALSDRRGIQRTRHGNPVPPAWTRKCSLQDLLRRLSGRIRKRVGPDFPCPPLGQVRLEFRRTARPHGHLRAVPISPPGCGSRYGVWTASGPSTA